MKRLYSIAIFTPALILAFPVDSYAAQTGIVLA